MPRPNSAQLAYGSATVVFSTVALLLLSGTTTTPGIAVICAAGLLIGLLVAVTMPARTRVVRKGGARSASWSAAPVPGHDDVRVPAERVGAGADTRIGS